MKYRSTVSRIGVVLGATAAAAMTWWGLSEIGCACMPCLNSADRWIWSPFVTGVIAGLLILVIYGVLYIFNVPRTVRAADKAECARGKTLRARHVRQIR